MKISSMGSGTFLAFSAFYKIHNHGHHICSIESRTFSRSSNLCKSSLSWWVEKTHGIGRFCISHVRCTATRTTKKLCKILRTKLTEKVVDSRCTRVEASNFSFALTDILLLSILHCTIVHGSHADNSTFSANTLTCANFIKSAICGKCAWKNYFDQSIIHMHYRLTLSSIVINLFIFHLFIEYTRSHCRRMNEQQPGVELQFANENRGEGRQLNWESRSWHCKRDRSFDHAFWIE